MAPDPRKLISIRLSEDDLARADALMPALERVPELAAARVTQAMVLRLAITEGLKVLEAKHATKRKGR